MFVDKTASVNFDQKEIAEKYQTALKQLVEEHISYEGDELIMYYLHENTAKARCLQVASRSTMEDLKGLNATDAEAAKTSFELSIKKERKNMLKKASAKMFRDNTGSSNKETAVLAAIPVIAEKGERFDQLYVYFFSDMIESCKNTRDFHVLAPNNNKTAAIWAKEDAKSFEELSLDNADIKVLLPFDPTSSSQINNPHIMAYWSEIFGLLGVPFEEI